MPQKDWSDEVAHTIGRQIRRYRDERGMSAQRLADAVSELGVPMERSVLAGLETGRRRTATVAEVVAFARILEVAPLALVYPLEESDLVEVVPGHVAESLAASKWFAGDAPFPDMPEGLGEEEMLAWGGDITALSQLRKHDRTVQLALTAVAAIRRTLTVGPFDLMQKEMRGLAEVLEKTVREERQKLRDEGVTPPPLPAGMGYIEGGDAPETAPPGALASLPDRSLSNEERAEFVAQSETILQALHNLERLVREERLREAQTGAARPFHDALWRDEPSESGDREAPSDGR